MRCCNPNWDTSFFIGQSVTCTFYHKRNNTKNNNNRCIATANNQLSLSDAPNHEGDVLTTLLRKSQEVEKNQQHKFAFIKNAGEGE